MAMKDKVTEQLKRTFRPEFLNRIDEIVVFHALNKVHITQIAEIMLKELRQQLGEMDIELVVTDQAKELLANKGFDPDFRGQAPAPGHPALHREPPGGGDPQGDLCGKGYHYRGYQRRGICVLLSSAGLRFHSWKGSTHWREAVVYSLS